MFTRKQIMALVIPLMLEQVLASLMGTADTMMISRVGSAAISAISLVDSLNMLMIQLFSAMATGGAIVCAQYIGRRDTANANASARQLLLSAAGIASVIAAVCIVFCRPLLGLIFGRVEQAVMDNAVTYMLITALSFPFLAMYNAGAALFRICGNSRLPMTVSVLSNLVNIAGNALLIFGLKLGVAGAAIPTLVSRMLCAAAMLYFLRKPHQAIILRGLRALRPEWKSIWQILRIGIPTGVENSMFQFGKLVIQSTVSTMGTTAIAANAMTAVLEGMISNAPIGVGLAMMTVVGQCMGAGRQEEAKKHIWGLTALGEAVLALSCALIFVLVRPITVLGGMEAEAADMTVRLTRLICLYKPVVWALAFLPGYGVRAAGDVKFSMILATTTMWSCRVLVTVTLARVFHMGPLAVWLGMFSDWTLRAIGYTWRMRSGRWARHQVIRDGTST